MIPINFPNIDMSHTHTHTDIYIYIYVIYIYINILLQASIDGSKPFKITIILTYIKHIFWNNP